MNKELKEEDLKEEDLKEELKEAKKWRDLYHDRYVLAHNKLIDITRIIEGKENEGKGEKNET